MSLSMSAIGHTMATMSHSGSKPGATSSDAGSRRSGANRNPTGNGNASPAAGRGQNINHLLAFTLPPRVSNSAAHTGPRRPRRGANYALPFNKERYVNAQYRFLVKPTGDYTAYFADADIYLNWSDILTVLISTTSALSTASQASAFASQPDHEAHDGAACPICLSPPTAPRMTKCGHVYCFPCILHYLTVHDAPVASGSTTPTPNFHQIPGAAPRASAPATPTGLSVAAAPSSAPKWKRCPVCWDAVYARDLKAVQWWDPKAQASEFERRHNDKEAANLSPSDDYLCMRLIERPHLTTLALPQTSTWPNGSTSTSDQPLIAQHAAPWHFQPDVMAFAKFMLATPELLLENLNGDLQQLEEERQLLQSFMTKDEAGLMFVRMAERKVHEQMEKVANELDTQSVRSRMGYARKELAEHYELEEGKLERDAEIISRRQRKKLERAKLESADEAGGNPERDDREAPKEFLAIQSSGKGGSSVTVAEDESVSSETFEDTKEDRFANDAQPRTTIPRSRRNLNPPAPSSSSFFFYQASSGQSIFLHPLDIKIMLSAHGSYAAFPKTLDVCIQGADEGSMNEEMRKRCKYLTHLSKGADIVFIEVDWDKMIRDTEAMDAVPAVSRKVLGLYDQPLKQRRTRRRDRERREDRAKLRSEEKERASRPAPMSSSRPIGIGGLARSPVLSAADDLGSSLGSQSALSPTLQSALLHSLGAPQSDEEFPTVHGSEGHGGVQDDHDAEAGTSAELLPPSHRRTSGNKPIYGASSTTIWGTPQAARGSFANALHKSSRATGHVDEDAPDWDAWLEIEEDFIVGARNNSTIREGRGLNKQGKKGEQGSGSGGGGGALNGAATPSMPHAKSALVSNGQSRGSSNGGSNSGSQDEGPTKEKPAQAQQTARSTPNKSSQKKKKLVLTSGGGGRGTR